MASPKTSSPSSTNVSISIFQGRFILQKLLGKGGFGEVYSGIQTSTLEPVAVKMERKVDNNSFLFHEARVMQDIQKRPTKDGQPGIATLKYFGQEGDFRMLIMTLQGPSLEDLHEKRQRFSLKTTIMLADQMLSRLEYIHSAGFVHRDLKPDNFLIGRENPNRIYLVDFGLSCRYLTQDGRLREMQSGKSFVGTSRYASLRTHQGFSQSRRDDIEQLVYVMIYMYRGHLPWSGLSIKNRDEKERRIGELKANLDPSEICANCPRQFTDLLFYGRNMSFTETPQYEICRAHLRAVLDEMNPPERMDYEFNWFAAPRRSSANANANNNEQAQPPQAQPQAVAAAVQKPTPQISPAVPLQPPLPTSPNATNTGAAAAAAGGAAAAADQLNRPPVAKNVNSPLTPTAPETGVLSNAKAQGFFSGFGSGAMSQEIMSLGDKS